MPRANESYLQTWNFDPITSESRNWLDEDLQGQAVHAMNQKSSMMLSWSRSIISLPKSSSESTQFFEKKQFRDDLLEAQMAYIDLTHTERSTQRHHRKSRD